MLAVSAGEIGSHLKAGIDAAGAWASRVRDELDFEGGDDLSTMEG